MVFSFILFFVVVLVVFVCFFIAHKMLMILLYRIGAS